MHEKFFKVVMILLVAVFFLAACGSEEGGEGDNPKRASAAFKLAGVMPSGQPVAGVQMTLHFPPGITVEIDTATGDVAASVIRVSGSGSPAVTGAYYLPATTTTDGELRFLVINTTGFTLGDFLELTLNVTPGTIPVATDFTLTNVSISDPDGNLLTGLQPLMTVTIQ